jgi:uncharacterized protein YecE (DUF72 family)
MPPARRRPVRIGCSGWNYDSWKRDVYAGKPQRLWLREYGRLFDTVEVNNTFYRLPLRSSVARWVEETAPHFVFAVKASRYLTHVKRLTDLDAGVARYYERLEPLVRSGRLGPVLWQLPATFRRDDERLAATLEALPAGRHCFEFRHASWFAEPVYELLRCHRAALVIGDRPEVHAFQSHELTADWTYVRFHHGSRGRRGNYSEAELETWARRFEDWRAEVEILAYFNNDWEAFAVRNAQWLKRRLST